MSVGNGRTVIHEDTVIKGEMRNGRVVEIHGYVEGRVLAESVKVHRTGRLFGEVRSETADIDGKLQGEAAIRNLIRIGSTGDVNGKVQYGRIAMEDGGSLSADLSNIPPEISGDLELVVERGGAVVIMPVDLQAIDPDDDAKDLAFSVSNARGGRVAMADRPAEPLVRFTQADLDSNRVLFVHAGGQGSAASFDVIVTDASGATSGSPQTVTVKVR